MELVKVGDCQKRVVIDRRVIESFEEFLEEAKGKKGKGGCGARGHKKERRHVFEESKLPLIVTVLQRYLYNFGSVCY